MSVAHNEVESMESYEETYDYWVSRKRPKAPDEPIITPHANLDEVLQDHTFIEYGRLFEYAELHEKGLEHFGYIGAQLVKKIRIGNEPVDPKLQADLLVRYIMTKAQDAGHNPIQYLSVYHIDHMTWQLALAGYEEKPDQKGKNPRLVAWNKLMRADRLREERTTTRRHLRRIPIDPSSSILPQPLPSIPHSASPH